MSFTSELVTAMTPPEPGKSKFYLLFNRANGAFYGFASWHEEHGFNPDYFVIVEEMFDPDNETVVGTYPDYKIELQVEQPQPIFEDFLNELTAQSITERYSIPTQINNIAAVVALIAERAGMGDEPLVQTLQDQIAEISDFVRNNQLRKAGYKNNPAFQYVSTEQAIAEENAKVEGGLYEVLGPRDIAFSS